jgi:prophage regulatory protein
MKYLRINQVIEKLGLKKPTIYAYMKRGLLPKPVKLGRVSIWLESEVDAALDARIIARDTSAKPGLK